MVNVLANRLEIDMEGSRLVIEKLRPGFVIAEAGTCHASPDVDLRISQAYRYVYEAGKAGADAIKFQLFNNPIRKDMFCWMDGDEAREQRWLDSCLPCHVWYSIKKFAEDGGLIFLASVFQFSTARWLSELGCKATKVASRAAKNFPYSLAPGPFFVSTGMYETQPIKGHNLLMECESVYPSTREWTGAMPGFSDHSGTPDRAIDAIRRGCKLVEVHFFIEECDAGPDLKASLNLDELKQVCTARNTL